MKGGKLTPHPLDRFVARRKKASDWRPADQRPNLGKDGVRTCDARLSEQKWSRTGGADGKGGYRVAYCGAASCVTLVGGESVCLRHLPKFANQVPAGREFPVAWLWGMGKPNPYLILRYTKSGAVLWEPSDKATNGGREMVVASWHLTEADCWRGHAESYRRRIRYLSFDIAREREALGKHLAMCKKRGVRVRP